MDPTIDALVAILLVSLAVPMVCFEHNVSWTTNGVSAFRIASTPLSVSIGDTLVLQCPPFSNSSVYLMYTAQQYDSCNVNVGGGGWLLISYCVLSSKVQNRFIHITENSNTVANVPDFRPGRLYYLASFGNMTYINYFATFGGECSLGLKMVVTVSCGNNCSQCNSTTLPSRCLECNPGYCLDNIRYICVPSSQSSCFVYNSSGTNQMGSSCANGLILINGNCTVNSSSQMGSGCANGYIGINGNCTMNATNQMGSNCLNEACIMNTEGDLSPNTHSSASIIAIAAGAVGGSLLVILLLFGSCCLLHVFLSHRPRGKVGIMLTTPESSQSSLMIKQEIAELPSLTVSGKDDIFSKIL